jgi:hypothetical protein
MANHLVEASVALKGCLGFANGLAVHKTPGQLNNLWGGEKTTPDCKTDTDGEEAQKQAGCLEEQPCACLKPFLGRQLRRFAGST